MLSYQHGYHAGCLSDVHKHSALSVILLHLSQKDEPVTYIETHAGRGAYDLTSKEAKKTGEAATGIVSVEKLFKPDHPYLLALKRTRDHYGSNFYPGSPLIAVLTLRQSDSFHFMELHPQEFASLRNTLKSPHIHLYQQDGYEGALALSPPSPQRGIVLIDPSYEVKSEYSNMAPFIQKLHQKWPEAMILLWYPILSAGHHNAMRDSLLAKFPEAWSQEVLFSNAPHRALGSGLLCVNLPSQLETPLNQLPKL